MKEKKYSAISSIVTNSDAYNLGDKIEILARNLRALRIGMNMQLAEMAKIAGVSKRTITNWESKNVVPSSKRVYLIAQHFGLTIQDFLTPNGVKVIADPNEFNTLKAISTRAPDNVDLNTDERSLIVAYRQIPYDVRDRIRELVITLANVPKTKNTPVTFNTDNKTKS